MKKIEAACKSYSAYIIYTEQLVISSMLVSELLHYARSKICGSPNFAFQFIEPIIIVHKEHRLNDFKKFIKNKKIY